MDACGPPLSIFPHEVEACVAYSSHKSPEPLPSLFAAHYHRVPLRSRYFDLWACSAVNMTNHTTPAAK